MIFRARVEVRFGSRDWWSYALVFQAQVPPRFVVLVRFDLSIEDLPAPFVDHQAEWEEGHFFQCLLQEVVDIARRGRYRLDQSDFLQIFRCDRESDGVADRFVESIVGAALE